MTRLEPKSSTIKQLFAVSGNQCAYPNCTSKLVEDNAVIGQIAHIEAAEENGPRYNAESNDEYRRSHANLFLLCANHHTLIDKKIDHFSTTLLKKYKKDHEKEKPDKVVVSDDMVSEFSDKFCEIINVVQNTGADVKDHVSNELQRHLGKDKIIPTENPLLDCEKYISAEFPEQIKLIKQQIIEDYEKFPKHRPIISNFRKFDGKKFFVMQKFQVLNSAEKGENIFQYVINRIRNYHDNKILEKTNIELIQKHESKITKSILPQKAKDEFKTKPTTTNETERQNKQIEKLSFEHFKIPMELISSVKEQKKLVLMIQREPNIIKQKTSLEEKLKKIQEISDQESNLKNEIKKLSEIDYQEISHEEVLKQKDSVIILQRELKELQKNSYEYSGNKITHENTIREFEKELSDISRAKDRFERINNTSKKLSPQDTAKMKEVKHILKEIRTVKQSFNHIFKAELEIRELSKEKIIPIIGDYGSGKSALMHHILYELARDEDKIPLFIPLGLLSKHNDNENHILDDLFDYLKNEYKFNFTRDFFLNGIKNNKFVLLLDALDEMSIKLDNITAQTNLNHIIEIAKGSIVVLTSRETYLSEGMKKSLLNYNDLVKILDFDNQQINTCLNLYIKNNDDRINEIKTVIEEERFSDFSRKPLFLNIIIQKFDILKSHVLINESIILEVLTDEWIKHDSTIKLESDLIKKEKFIQSRQKISEILAFAEYTKGKPIGIDDIKNEVQNEFQYNDADARRDLSKYYKDAISSTFLVNEENETYRFIIKPIMEYFMAKRIVNEIKSNQSEQLLRHVKALDHVEIFDFIKGIIDIEWAIKPHLLEKILKITENSNESQDNSEKILKVKEIISSQKARGNHLFQMIRKLGSTSEHNNVGKLLQILHITGSLPPRPNLSSLILGKANLRGINLSKSNLTGVNFVDADLTGADFSESNLTDANLSGATLVGCNFTKSIVNETIFENANMSNSELVEMTLNKKTNLKNIIFNGSTIKSINLKEKTISGSSFVNCVFSDTTLNGVIGNKCDFRSAYLKEASLQGALFHDSDFRDAILKNANIVKTEFRRNKLDGADFSHAIVDRDTNFSSSQIHNTKFLGVNIRDTIRNNLDLVDAVDVEQNNK